MDIQHDLVTINDPTNSLTELIEEVRVTQYYMDSSKAESTKRAYENNWRVFERWCQMRGAVSLPALPKAVAVFLASQAKRGLKASTIGRRQAAIKFEHKSKEYISPTDDGF